MTRKQFLVHMGIMLFVLTGISGVLKTISDPHLASKGLPREALAKRGFGSGPYGA